MCQVTCSGRLQGTRCRQQPAVTRPLHCCSPCGSDLLTLPQNPATSQASGDPSVSPFLSHLRRASSVTGCKEPAVSCVCSFTLYETFKTMFTCPQCAWLEQTRGKGLLEPVTEFNPCSLNLLGGPRRGQFKRPYCRRWLAGGWQH